MLHGCGVNNVSALLILAAGLSGIAAYLGMRSVHHHRRSPWTVTWMFLSFCFQCGALGLRGELRGQCPLGDIGEILVFMAWSMTMFYLIIGSTYRLSLLGVFSAPLVTLMLGLGALPGMMEVAPERSMHLDPWNESHAALSVLSYGAFALAAIAGVMYLVLNKQLKSHATNSGLFRELPSLSSITSSMKRLILVGVMLLTAGITCGLYMENSSPGYLMHLWAAVGVWLAYVAVLMVTVVRGMSPTRLAWGALILFVVSLWVFAAI